MVRALRIHLLIVVLAALTAAALAGCGGGDEEAGGDAAWEDTYADEESLSSVRAQLAMDRPAYMAPIDALKEIVVTKKKPCSRPRRRPCPRLRPKLRECRDSQDFRGIPAPLALQRRSHSQQRHRCQRQPQI